MTKVLLVEDRIHVAQRIAGHLERTGGIELCAIAYDLQTGFKLIYEHRPDILLCDLGLPDGSGLDLIKAAGEADWPCASMVLSTFGNEDRVYEAIRLGAKGYLLKGDSLDSIGRQVQTLANGGSPVSPMIARYLLQNVPEKSQAEVGEQPALTPREASVLTLIARGLKRQDIADQLGISLGTVGTHIFNIYRKLGVGSNIQAVHIATKRGLL